VQAGRQFEDDEQPQVRHALEVGRDVQE
jgi:hypothetical protein